MSGDVIAAMRKRPGMYVGDVHDGSGLLHLLWEVVANALDEHLAGHAKTVRVTVEQGDWFVVDDDGRGLDPAVALHALTSSHDANTLDDHQPQVHVSALRGVGIVAVNALAEWMVIETRRDGRTLRARLARGEVIEPFADVGPSERRGTRIAFKPDPEIFPSARIDLRAIQERLEELGAFFPEVTFELTVAPRAMRLARGIADLATLGIDRWYLLHDPVHWRAHQGATSIELAFAFLRGGAGRMRAYSNGIPNPEGGTHVTGFLRGLHELFESGGTAPLRTHVTAVVHAMCLEPQYAGLTHGKLVNAELQALFERETRAALRAFAAAHPELVEQIRAAIRG